MAIRLDSVITERLLYARREHAEGRRKDYGTSRRTSSLLRRENFPRCDDAASKLPSRSVQPFDRKRRRQRLGMGFAPSAGDGGSDDTGGSGTCAGDGGLPKGNNEGSPRPGGGSMVADTAVTLAVGAVGGASFELAGLPLPWMLGAMASTSLTAISSGWGRLRVSPGLRFAMQTVIGINLGAKFTQGLFAKAAGMLWSVLGLLVFSACAAALGAAFLRHVVGYDPKTAFFAAVPGGLNDMLVIGGELGADTRVVGLTHVCRLIIVVSTLPLLISFASGPPEMPLGANPVAAAALPIATAPSSLSEGPALLAEAVLLLLCALVGPRVGKALRLPARFVVGPMLLSAILHLLGTVSGALMPPWTVQVAQLVIATGVGCRFVGVAPRFVGEVFLNALGSTAILLALSLAFSATSAALTGFPLPLVVLSYSPGGITEACITALALGFDAAFVATHHVLRISFLVLITPLISRLLLPPVADDAEASPVDDGKAGSGSCAAGS